MSVMRKGELVAAFLIICSSSCAQSRKPSCGTFGLTSTRKVRNIWTNVKLALKSAVQKPGFIRFEH